MNHLIQTIEEEIAQLQALRAKLEQLPDGLPSDVYLSSSEQVVFRIPYSRPALRQFRHTLGKGWKRDGGWTAEDGRRFIEWRNESLGIRAGVCLKPDWEGSTCRKVQTGTKEVPLFEVVCQ